MTRHQYRADLARPLKRRETAISKLPLLRADLGATSDRDAVCKMLVRHVIGKNVRQWAYPIEVRGEPVSGPTAEQRLPALYAYLGTSDVSVVLLMLAQRHVPGFTEPSLKRAGGRPRRVNAVGATRAERECQARALEAHIIDMFHEWLADNPGKSRKQIAYLVADQTGADPLWVLEVCKPAKARRFDNRLSKILQKLARVIADQRASKRPNNPT